MRLPTRCRPTARRRRRAQPTRALAGAGVGCSDGAHLAFLGLGSNLGPRLAQLARAVELLAGRGLVPCGCSPVYESAALGPWPEQPPFLNAVVAVRTRLGAEQVLRAALAVERAMGRRRLRAQGPRLIDIDLLLFDQVVRQHPAPTLPHPRLCERAFALRPLLELQAALCHPQDGLPLAQHLAATTEQRLVHRGRLFRG